MAEKKLYALVGLHPGQSTDFLASLLSSIGYASDFAETTEDMVSFCKNKTYDLYLMELNLGNPNSLDITPAKQVYNMVKHKLEKGEGVFYGVSGNIDTVCNAEEAGIPAIDRNDLNLELLKLPKSS